MLRGQLLPQRRRDGLHVVPRRQLLSVLGADHQPGVRCGQLHGGYGRLRLRIVRGHYVRRGRGDGLLRIVSRRHIRRRFIFVLRSMRRWLLLEQCRRVCMHVVWCWQLDGDDGRVCIRGVLAVSCRVPVRCGPRELQCGLLLSVWLFCCGRVPSELVLCFDESVCASSLSSGQFLRVDGSVQRVCVPGRIGVQQLRLEC